MAQLVCLGELLIDFTPCGQSDAGMQLYERNPGGAPANVAVAAARLGLSAAMIGKVGNDPHGRFLRDTLAAEGVDVSGAGDAFWAAYLYARLRGRVEPLRFACAAGALCVEKRGAIPAMPTLAEAEARTNG